MSKRKLDKLLVKIIEDNGLNIFLYALEDAYEALENAQDEGTDNQLALGRLRSGLLTDIHAINTYDVTV
jgi:hypothetical protein